MIKRLAWYSGTVQQAACEDKEKKLQKDLVKGTKDIAVTQDKLKHATDSLQLADAEGELPHCL